MPTAFDINADTRAVADLLNAVTIGSIVTLDAISSAIGRDVRPVRYIILAGLKVAQNETGALFATVRKVGYRRLEASEFAEIGGTARARIRRAANRSVRAMEAGMARLNDMDNAARTKILREQSTLGLIAHLSKDKSLPSLPTDSTRPQPIAITMRGALEAMGVKLPQGGEA